MSVTLTIFLALLLPLCLIPLLMRLFVSRLILALIKRKYLPKALKNMHDGWQTDQDLQAIQAVTQLAQERLKYHFLLSYKFKEDLESILLCIQHIYAPDSQAKKIKFSFSVKKLVYCCLLGFCDLYKEYSEQKWFKVIKNIRLIWFWRFSELNRHIQTVFSRLPFLDKLRKTRLLGPITRLLLIPLFGVPLLIWYVIRSISVSIFYEGFLRYFYGLLFLKVGYYTIYLYGRENTVINKRIAQIPKKRITLISKDIESIIANAFQSKKSIHFDRAFTIYQTLLKEFGLDEDTKLTSYSLTEDAAQSQVLGKKIIKSFNDFIMNSKEAYKKQNPFVATESKDKQQLLKLYYELGKVYFPKAKEPGIMLRLTDALEIGYMSSILLLNFFFATPGVKMLLGNISVDLILKFKKLTTNELLRNTMANFNNSYKYVSIINKIYQVFKIARGIASPYQLIFTLSGPIVVQYIQKAFRQFIYHKSGRLLLYGWEASQLKKSSELTSLLWEL